MKIKRYYFEKFITTLLITIIAFSAASYFMYIICKRDLLISGVFSSIFIICVITMINRRIIIYEDRMIIIQMWQKVEIEFDCIKSLKVDTCIIKNSPMSADVICATLQDNSNKMIYYKPYARENIIEIIEYVLKKNINIKLDSNIKAFLRNEETEYYIRRKEQFKKEQIAFMLLLVGMVIMKVIHMYIKSKLM